MLLATGLAGGLGHAAPLALVGLASFVVFVLYNRPAWQPLSWWGGPANLVTALRLLGLMLIAAWGLTWHPWALAAVALLILITDGLDGYLARRFRTQSLFGEYFDKETDAYFVLVLSTQLALAGRIGFWVTGLGLLRYLYVLALIYFKPPTRKEGRSFFGQVVAVLLMLSLILGWLLPATWYLPLQIGIGLLVVYSFGRSFVAMRRPQSPPPVSASSPQPHPTSEL